jgi:endonuclease/exonuclease/phosphatase family metal-dependent hydrolase
MRRLVHLIFLFAAVQSAWATRAFTVMAYNPDNLVGVDGRTASEEYLPRQYTRAHLLTKMNNIARVAEQVEPARGPDIILFQEFERDLQAGHYSYDYDGMLRRYEDMRVEEMLGERFTPEIAQIPIEGLLLKTFSDRGLKGYHIVSADDAILPDARHYITHLNVVFTRYPVGIVHTYLLPGAPAMMEVQVEVEGYPLYLFNVDWAQDPTSRDAENLRIKAAEILRARLDEIFSVNPNADVIIAGDFNCFYDQRFRYPWSRTALHDVLKVRGDELLLRSSSDYLYNLWYELPPSDRGSEIFAEGWGSFMQMIVSRGLYDFRGIQYVDNSFQVAAYEKLNARDDGTPMPWSFFGTGSGFSTHFPLAAHFVTVRNNRADQFLQLPSHLPYLESTVQAASQ